MDANSVALNICMNKYIAMVRVKGQAIRTMVFADGLIHARLILQYQFGMDSIVASPIQIGKINRGCYSITARR
jgi:hypothetical protein